MLVAAAVASRPGWKRTWPTARKSIAQQQCRATLCLSLHHATAYCAPATLEHHRRVMIDIKIEREKGKRLREEEDSGGSKKKRGKKEWGRKKGKEEKNRK
jgi:hypothetical protein